MFTALFIIISPVKVLKLIPGKMVKIDITAGDNDTNPLVLKNLFVLHNCR